MYPLSPSPKSPTQIPNGPENKILTKWANRMRLIDITYRSSHFKVPKHKLLIQQEVNYYLACT